MKALLGITGYIFLIIGAVFIDTPIIALLAVPIFIAGIVLLINFYYNLVNKFIKLILSGVIIVFGTLGYTAIEYNQYLVLLSRDEIEGFFPFWKVKIMVILAIHFIASFLVYTGLKKGKQFSNPKILSLWLPIIIILPLTILIIQYTYWTDNWMGG